MSTYPKLVAFETRGVLYIGDLTKNLWGKGAGADQKLSNNVQRIDARSLRDKSNNANTATLCKDIPKIINDVLKHGASIAIISQSQDKSLTDRALYYFHANDANDQERPIIELVRYDEVVDEPKSEHFKRIHGWSKFAYEDMVLFDKSAETDLEKQGITVLQSDPAEGLTWPLYAQGIEAWQSKQGTGGKPKTQILKIAHFNDAYKVGDQKVKVNGVQEVINVSKFSGFLNGVKKQWKADGLTGLTVFSGDLFSPSTQSSVTRGMHMAPIINALNVDVSVLGNHEFDFGLPQLVKLIPMTQFPWLFSNIVDTDTGKVPVPMEELLVVERDGLRIGFIGLIEQEWIPTITGWPENFKFLEMKEVGVRLSKVLRDPAGPHKCDLVIAVTHCRIPNDIKLARDLFALSTESPDYGSIASHQGVDILLGGHDHNYWVSRGVSSWDGYDVTQLDEDAKDDRGDVLVVKSGTDFQDLTEITLTLKDAPAGSIRKKIVTSTIGTKHSITTSAPVDPEMEKVVSKELSVLQASLGEPICITSVALDTKSKFIRFQESPIGNWVADCLLPVYNEVLTKLVNANANGVVICTGDIRDGPLFTENGIITLGDLMEILPFTDATVVLEMTGADLWTALESGLGQWPAQQGRFPAISGFRVEWKSQNPSLSRVQGIWLQETTNELGPDKRPKKIDKEQIPRDSKKKYLIVTGNYLASGGDGYDIFKSQKVVLNEENGKLKSALVRQFLLGAHYVNTLTQSNTAPKQESLSPEAFKFVTTARAAIEIPNIGVPKFDAPKLDVSTFGLPQVNRSLQTPTFLKDAVSRGSSSLSDLQRAGQDTVQTVQQAVASTLTWVSSPDLIKIALNISEKEDMGSVDPYERHRLRIELSMSIQNRSTRSLDQKSFMAQAHQAQEQEKKDVEKNLPIISPIIDGRLKDLDGKAGK